MLSVNKNAFFRLFDNKLFCYLFPFVLLCLPMVYLLISGYNFYADAYYTLHYIYTYKHGFHSRGLIGEIISWFADTVTPELIRGIIIFGSFFFIAAACLCIGFAFYRTHSDKQVFNTVLLIFAVLCLISTGYRGYICDDRLDKFVWAITFLALLLTENQIAVCFSPLFCFLAILINPVFFFECMVIIAIALLQKLHDEQCSKKMIAVCSVTFLGMIALGLFSAWSEQRLGFSSGEEFLQFYAARYSDPNCFENVSAFVELGIFDFLNPPVASLKHAFQTYFLEKNKDSVIFNTLFVAVPMFLIFGSFWKRCLKKANNILQKSIFILCLLSPLIVVFATIVSWETMKYVAHYINAQLCLIIYFLVHNNAPVLSAATDVKRFCKRNIIPVSILAVFLSLFFVS